MKILLAVDGSKHTKKMLAYMTTHDDLFSADNQYTVLNAQAPLPHRARAAVGADIANDYYAEEAEKVLAPVTKFLERHGIQAQSSWKVGHAAEVISRHAMTGKFDLLVMGSHGHGALGSLVMGSVTTKVMASCEVPILLIR
ncbi:MAG: universal stress protein [Burkholderiaceae bacterium]